MTRTPATTAAPTDVLRGIALRYPEVEEGLSCNRTAFAARGKAFLFAGAGAGGEGWVVLVKLRDSLAEAEALARKEPRRYAVGKTGWVTLRLGPAEALPRGVMERWIDESYRLLAHEELVARLGVVGTAAKVGVAKARAKKVRAKKVT
jgi:hypothetical protein